MASEGQEEGCLDGRKKEIQPQRQYNGKWIPNLKHQCDSKIIT